MNSEIERALQKAWMKFMPPLVNSYLTVTRGNNYSGLISDRSGTVHLSDVLIFLVKWIRVEEVKQGPSAGRTSGDSALESAHSLLRCSGTNMLY